MNANTLQQKVLIEDSVQSILELVQAVLGASSSQHVSLLVKVWDIPTYIKLLTASFILKQLLSLLLHIVPSQHCQVCCLEMGTGSGVAEEANGCLWN